MTLLTSIFKGVPQKPSFKLDFVTLLNKRFVPFIMLRLYHKKKKGRWFFIFRGEFSLKKKKKRWRPSRSFWSLLKCDKFHVLPCSRWNQRKVEGGGEWGETYYYGFSKRARTGGGERKGKMKQNGKRSLHLEKGFSFVNDLLKRRKIVSLIFSR
jgi:hypothetical protein